MKKILFPLLAVAAMAAAPAAYARTIHGGSWDVLMDGNFYSCYAANHGPSNGEVKVGGPYASQAQASAAMGATAKCAAPEAND